MWLALAISCSVAFIGGIAARELAGGFSGSGAVLLHFIRKELRKMSQEITDRIAASDAAAAAGFAALGAAVARVQEDIDFLLQGLTLSDEQRAAWDAVDAKLQQIVDTASSVDPLPNNPPPPPPPEL